MTRITLLLMAALLLANCGIQRPLIKPGEIAAYEESRRKKREQLEEDMKNYEALTAAEKAAAPTTEAAPATALDAD